MVMVGLALSLVRSTVTNEAPTVMSGLGAGEMRRLRTSLYIGDFQKRVSWILVIGGNG